MKNLVCGVVCLFSSLPVCAQEISLTTSNDAGLHSTGINGISVLEGNESIQVSRSGGSNIHHGAFVFDLSSVPMGTTVNSAAIRLVTTALISNTQSTATVAFHGYASDQIIDILDFDNPAPTSATLLADPTFQANVGGPDAGSPLTISLDNLVPIQQAIANESSFFTVRSETVNFVTLQIASLENTSDYAALQLVLNYELLCDIDGDQSCTTTDIDMLVGALAAGSTDLQYDIDDSGVVDGADLDRWLSIAGHENLAVRRPYLVGDANLDGAVNGADFVAWNANKFTSTATWSGGDFNADGDVNGADFVLWNAHKFTSSDAVAVPEPGIHWLGMAIAVLVRGRSCRGLG